MKTKELSKKEWIVTLGFLYVIVVFGRFVLALMTTSFPTVDIDEFLYYSLARSIATKGQLLFRGQPADYAYLVYPLALSPVYLLFREGAHFYRLLQLWNIMLMSASVFPLFFLGEKLLGSKKKAFAAAAVAMLLPDFILGEMLFSEAVLYPLFFALMYFAYDYIDGGARRSVLWIGVIGGLLYSTKPGAVAPAAVFALFVLGRGIKNKSKKELLDTLTLLLGAVAVAAVFWAMARYAFGYEGKMMSIYSSQLDGSENWAYWSTTHFLKALAVYPYYFILSCGIVGVVYPAISWEKWDPKIRIFWWYLVAALIIMFIGSARVVEQAKKNNYQIRYVAMYIPLLLQLCFVTDQEPIGKKKSAPKKPSLLGMGFLLGYVVLCTLAFGCKINSQVINAFPILPLSILNDKFLPLSKQVLGNVILVVLCAAVFLLFMTAYGKKNFYAACVGIISVFMLINGISGYSVIRGNYYPPLEKDGIAALRLTEGRPYLYLRSSDTVTDIGVDVNARSNNVIVFTNDFINDLQRNSGVYVPYMPEKTRGMASVRETPDVDTLVVDYDSFSLLQLSEHAFASSPSERNSIFVVRFIPGERLVDSTLGNLTNRKLSPGKPGILLLYNEDWYEQPLTIRLKIESAAAQTLTINSTHELYSIELSSGEDWYEIPFNQAEAAFNFTVPDAEITVSAHELKVGG